MGVIQELQDGFHSIRDRFFFTKSLYVHPQMNALRDLPKIITTFGANTERFSVDNGEFLVNGLSSAAFIRGLHSIGVVMPQVTVGGNTRLTTGVFLPNLREADVIIANQAFSSPSWPAGIVFEGAAWMADNLVGFKFQNVTAGSLVVPDMTWVLLIVNLSAK